MISTEIKLLYNKRSFIFNYKLRKVIFDLANDNNYDDQDYYPDYYEKKINYTKKKFKYK